MPCNLQSIECCLLMHFPTIKGCGGTGTEERFSATCPPGAYVTGFRGRAWAGQPELESCVLAALTSQQSNPESSILYSQLVNLRDRIVRTILDQAAATADPAWNGLFTVRSVIK